MNYIYIYIYIYIYESALTSQNHGDALRCDDVGDADDDGDGVPPSIHLQKQILQKQSLHDANKRDTQLWRYSLYMKQKFAFNFKNYKLQSTWISGILLLLLLTTRPTHSIYLNLTYIT
jgi:hypothetical protein